MLPRPFSYHRPESLDEALAFLDDTSLEAAPYAGGTEFLLAMKMRFAEVDRLIDLKRIPGLSTITADRLTLSIGALATHTAIASSDLVRQYMPALSALCASIANMRVRNSGTIGGNLCFAEPRADPPTLLASVGAVLRLASSSGTRNVAAGDFITGPLETVRKDGEILTAIEIDRSCGVARHARIAFGHRPIATAAAMIVPGPLPRSSLWLGAVADRPVQMTGCEDIFAGSTIELKTLNVALETEISAMDIDGDEEASAEYRKHLAVTAATRAITAAAEASGRTVVP